MQFSGAYQKSIDREIGNGFYRLDTNINTFVVLLEIFHSIQLLNDFTHFRRNFPPEWIYIPAIRLKNFSLWNSLFGWVYRYHSQYDPSFLQRLAPKGIINESDFLLYMQSIYDSIIENNGIPYDKDLDISVTFCSESISDIIRKYCSESCIDNCNTHLIIHPVERRGSINKVLFYRASHDNQYVEKMFDDYNEGQNTKRLAKDFLSYLEFTHKNDISATPSSR